MELKNLSAMIEWWSGLDGPNGLTSAPMSYDLMNTRLKSNRFPLSHELSEHGSFVKWMEQRSESS